MTAPRFRVRATLTALAALALVVASGAARADDAQVEQGHKIFKDEGCPQCHGFGGKGDGMLASVLKQKPADLTLIAQKNGGKFPEQTVMRFIDGTTDVRAHGNPDMPVWGEVFKEHIASSPTQQAEIRATILSIVNYIGSIQQK